MYSRGPVTEGCPFADQIRKPVLNVQGLDSDQLKHQSDSDLHFKTCLRGYARQGD